jgi:GH25 family lysozyme M1 (1,4-beta-N-acetylmuramidase)
VTLDPLIVDTYAGDGYGGPDIQKLASAGPPWHGLILKATEGTGYPSKGSPDREWFLDNWIRARVYAGSRYGVDWFRGAYHYLHIGIDPVQQADWFLSTVAEAGGWSSGDLWPMVDVEGADNPDSPGSAAIVSCVSAFTARVLARTGKHCTLYGNVYLAENGVADHMGCETLCIARDTETLPETIYQRIGWQLGDAKPTVLSWQLCGDGVVYDPGYPTVTPMGKCDYSAIIVAGGGDAALAWIAAQLAS